MTGQKDGCYKYHYSPVSQEQIVITTSNSVELAVMGVTHMTHFLRQ